MPALELLGVVYEKRGGKALQALRALTGSPLALKKDKILGRPEIKEQSRWLEEVEIPRVPNTRLKALGGSLKVLQVFRTMARSPMEFLISTTTALRIPTQSQRTGAAKKPSTTFSTYPGSWRGL